MILYLIRGLPGSGKSTLAQKLVGFEHVVEADMFFVDPEGYHYDSAKIGTAHLWCQNETEQLISSGLVGDAVAVANTFTQRWEMEPYYNLMNNYDIKIIEITVSVRLTDEELALRCVHKVPVNKITQMRLRWEL